MKNPTMIGDATHSLGKAQHSKNVRNVRPYSVSMLGPRDFIALPGERAAVWDKILMGSTRTGTQPSTSNLTHSKVVNTNVKEFHEMNILQKRKKVKEDYYNITKGKGTQKAETVKSKQKRDTNASSSLKTSSISSNQN